MATKRPEETDERDESARVIGWRAEQLIGALGLTSRQAVALAESTVDLAAFIDEYHALLAAGCPKRLALRILRPLPSRA